MKDVFETPHIQISPVDFDQISPADSSKTATQIWATAVRIYFYSQQTFLDFVHSEPDKPKQHLDYRRRLGFTVLRFNDNHSKIPGG